MRVTRYTDYSLRMLIYLAVQGERRSTIGEISDAYGISKNHLMKVAQQLAADGFVDSARGVNGGVKLARPAEDINIGEVVRLMEPDLGLVECMRADNECVITPACRLRSVLHRAKSQFIDCLDQVSLSEVVPESKAPELRTLLRIKLAMD